MELHKSMPHSDELERAVLSACLFFRDDRAIAVEQLTADDFYTARNAELFSVLRALERGGVPADDVLLVRDACRDKRNALALLDELGVSLHPDIGALCSKLRDLSAARRITRACFSVAAQGIECSAEPISFLDRASAELTAAIQARDPGTQCTPLAALCEGLIASQLADKASKPNGCLATGVFQVDGMIGGLESGRLYVVAGRPGMGKSALAIQFAESAARAGARGVVFSLEMPSREITLRMACSNARVDSRALTNGALSEIEWKRLTCATEKISKLPIAMVEGGGLNVEQIARVARAEKLRNGLGLVVVDYLQLVRSGKKHDSREQEVSEISRELKLLARELDVPVIAVSQLNRELERRADKRPLMSDLRESGAIEQDADVILMLYRDDYYDTNSPARGVCEVIVAKNRAGETGIVRAKFEARFTRFGDL